MLHRGKGSIDPVTARELFTLSLAVTVIYNILVKQKRFFNAKRNTWNQLPPRKKYVSKACIVTWNTK